LYSMKLKHNASKGNRSMELHGKQIIGRKVSAEGPATIQATNPATGEKLALRFHSATPDEVARASALAHQSFGWLRKTGPEERASFLEAIAAELEILSDALIDRCQLETGLPPARLRA